VWQTGSHREDKKVKDSWDLVTAEVNSCSLSQQLIECVTQVRLNQILGIQKMSKVKFLSPAR
jgi:hypothetical protein